MMTPALERAASLCSAILVVAFLSSVATILPPSPSVSAGTLIIVFKDSSGILLAADSLASRIDGRGNVQRRETCKIHAEGRFVYAIAGVTVETSSGMDLVASLKDPALFHQASLREFVLAGTSVIQTEMDRALDFLRANVPARFDGFARDLNGTTVMFVGADDDGELIAITRSYATTQRTGVVTPGPIKQVVANVGQWAAIGHVKSTRDRPPERISAALLASPIAELNRMILTQAKLTPERVGGAINIFRMSARGPQWPQREAACR